MTFNFWVYSYFDDLLTSSEFYWRALIDLVSILLTWETPFKNISYPSFRVDFDLEFIIKSVTS
jgi:hypothetical protein